MRVIKAPREREQDCACGARFAYVPSDVARTSVPVDAPDLRNAAPVGVTVVGEWKSVRIVVCPICNATIEVEGGT